jgi:Flp pilus assembly protein TadD
MDKLTQSHEVVQLFTFKNNTSSAEMKLDQCMSFFQKGKKALDANETDKAIELFKSAIDNLGKDKMSLDDSATFYSYLGLAYQKKGWKDYAQAHFNKALKLNANDPVALKNLSTNKIQEKKVLSLSEKIKVFLSMKKQ